MASSRGARSGVDRTARDDNVRSVSHPLPCVFPVTSCPFRTRSGWKRRRADYLPRADSSLKAKGVLIWWPFYRRWSSSGDRHHWDGMLATLMSVRAFGSSVSGKVGFELRPKSPAGGVAFDPCHLEAAHAFSSQSSLRVPSQLVRTRRGSLVSRLRAD
jgi:hypothetical protein